VQKCGVEGTHQIFLSKRVIARQTFNCQGWVPASYQQTNEDCGTHPQEYNAHVILGEHTGQQNLAGKANGGTSKSYADKINCQ